MKSTAASIVIVSIIIASVIILSNNSTQSTNINNPNTEIVNLKNVNIIDGQQIIDIDVRGGYSPRKSFAKAGIPTILRFNTKGTFDCSASIRIPSLNIMQILPQTGTTEIKAGNPKEGILQGSCGMGMYQFSVEFK